MFEDAYEQAIGRKLEMSEYMDILYETVKAIPNCEVLEFGVADGVSTRAFLRAVEDCKGQLTSVDIRYYSATEEMLMESERWEYVILDSKEFKSNKKFDVILVDSLHNYHQVSAECEVIKKVSKPGTVIFFHDICFEPTIKKAIDEFTESIKCETDNVSVEDKYGMFKVTLK